MDNCEIEKLFNNIEKEESDEGFSDSFNYLLKIIKDEATFKSTIGEKGTNKFKVVRFLKKLTLINNNITKKNKKIDEAYLVGLLLYKLGYKFTKRELSRFFLCGLMSTGKTNLLELFKSSQESQNIEFISEIRKLLEILNDNSKTKEYISNYMDYNSENKYFYEVLNLLSVLVIRDKVNINPTINKNVGYISDALGRLKDSYRILSIEADIGMNQEFLNLVYEGITDETPRAGLPYKLYENLNKNVIYNSTFSSWNQDISIPIIRKIYDKSFTNITRESNDVTCKSWSEAYAYLLNKEGFRAYISNKRLLHRYVIFFDDENNMYVADGTNNSFNKHQLLEMSDITRAKMNCNPALFYRVECNENGQIRNQYYYNGDFLSEEEIIKLQGKISNDEKRTIRKAVSLLGRYSSIKPLGENESIDEDLILWRDILKIIEKRNNIPDLLKFIPGETEDEINFKKLQLINLITMDVVSNYNYDDSMVYDCLRNLIYILYKKDGLKLGMDSEDLFNGPTSVRPIKLSNNLYRIIDGKVEIVPLLYLRQKDELVYYLWDNKEGLKQTEKNEIIKKIVNDELHSRINNKPLSQFYIDREIIDGIESPYKSYLDEKAVITETHPEYEKLGWDSISFEDYFGNECPEDDCVDNEEK